MDRYSEFCKPSRGSIFCINARATWPPSSGKIGSMLKIAHSKFKTLIERNSNCKYGILVKVGSLKRTTGIGITNNHQTSSPPIASPIPIIASANTTLANGPAIDTIICWLAVKLGCLPLPHEFLLGIAIPPIQCSTIRESIPNQRKAHVCPSSWNRIDTKNTNVTTSSETPTLPFPWSNPPPNNSGPRKNSGCTRTWNPNRVNWMSYPVCPGSDKNTCDQSTKLSCCFGEH